MMQPQHPEIAIAMRILFVDDEKNVLDGLRRAMHGMRKEWKMDFALGGVEALELLQKSPVDVVVTDMRMPGLGGGELLAEVKRLYPQAIRFILSGYAEPNCVMQVAGTAHQYLSKPCDGSALKVAIARTITLRNLLGDKKLADRAGSVDTLPSIPSAYQKIVSCMKDSESTIADVATIVNTDVVMTAMVLKLANSAFFGAGQSFRTADRAVSFLGLDTIAGLVLAHGVFNQVSDAQSGKLDIDSLWRHSLKTAEGARALAVGESWNAVQVEEVFLASILHDLGRLVLAMRPATVASYGALIECDADLHSWDEGHAEIGAYLLGLWGFSDSVIEAIAFHHQPSKAAGKQFGLPGLLHVADCLSHHIESGAALPDVLGLEPGYLESRGLHGRVTDWCAKWSKASAQSSFDD